MERLLNIMVGLTIHRKSFNFTSNYFKTRSWGGGSPYLSSPEAAAAAGLRIPPLAHQGQVVDDAIVPKHVCQEPYSLMDPSVLQNLWRVVYWSSQFLTW